MRCQAPAHQFEMLIVDPRSAFRHMRKMFGRPRERNQAVSVPLLARVGTVIYGPHFVHAVARDLDVSPRTVERWIGGQHPVPDRIYIELGMIAARRMVDLQTLIDEMKNLTKGTP